jgi:proline dehydrogenase
VPVRPGTALRRLLPRRRVADRDPVDVARELVDAGFLVALESGHVALVERVGSIGLAPACELTVPVDRLGLEAARELGSLASDAGFAVVLSGSAATVAAVGLPGAGVVVPAGEPGAEDRCRALSGGHVRLVAGRRRGGADLAFVRCLNVLMAGEGHPGVAVSDPRLIAIAGERAAWNGRTSDSWELVMPYGEMVSEQRRLVAAGSVVRVSVGGRR